jgi:hypothetical protein
MLNIVTLSVFMLSAVLLNVAMMTVIMVTSMLIFIILIEIMPSVVTLIVILLNVIVPSVVAAKLRAIPFYPWLKGGSSLRYFTPFQAIVPPLTIGPLNGELELKPQKTIFESKCWTIRGPTLQNFLSTSSMLWNNKLKY